MGEKKKSELNMRYDERIRGLQNAQEENYINRKLIERKKDVLNQASLRSKAWLERCESMMPKNGRARARLNELWQNHEYVINEVDVSFTEALASNSSNRDLLSLEQDNLIVEQKKVLQNQDREGEQNNGNRDTSQ